MLYALFIWQWLSIKPILNHLLRKSYQLFRVLLYTHTNPAEKVLFKNRVFSDMYNIFVNLNKAFTCFQYALVRVKTKPRSMTDSKSFRKKARLVFSLSTNSRSWFEEVHVLNILKCFCSWQFKHDRCFITLQKWNKWKKYLSGPKMYWMIAKSIHKCVNKILTYSIGF